MREYQEVRRHPMLTKAAPLLEPNRCRHGIHHQQSQSSPRLVSADRVLNVRRRSGKATGSRMASFVAMNSDATTFSEP